MAPKCEDIIIKCKWDGMYMNCSQNFTLRASRDGFCCTFNYVRQNRIYSLNKYKNGLYIIYVLYTRALIYFIEL